MKTTADIQKQSPVKSSFEKALTSKGNFFAPVIQTKLTVNTAGDRYEQEADATAEKIMRMPACIPMAKSFYSPATTVVQRCDCDKEELHRKEDSGHESRSISEQCFPIQRKCAACAEEEKLQRKETNASTPVVTSAVTQVLSSSGHPLDAGTKSFMESRFGHDFASVRVHDNTDAHQSSSDIQAKAYTHGNNIVFGKGRYKPSSDEGKQLLAHELTHVLQQRRNNLPLISRKSVTREFLQHDNSILTITRNTKPGKCSLSPKSASKSDHAIKADKAFIQFDYCKGRFGASAGGEINYGESIRAARDAARNLFNGLSGGANAQQSIDDFQRVMQQLSPDAKVAIKLSYGPAALDVEATGTASDQSGASGRITARGEVKIGGIVIKAEASVGDGTQRDRDYQVIVSVGNSSDRESADCRICNCATPEPVYVCNLKQPPGVPDKTPPPVTQLIPLYFEYEQTIPRLGWEKTYEKMLQQATVLLKKGYTIERIEGYTSPEGPLKASKPGRFENQKLSEDRAEEAWQDLRKEIIANAGKLLTIDPSVISTDRFRQIADTRPKVVGLGEVFGSTGSGEVSNSKLFSHIRKLDRDAQVEGKDIFTENRVVGAGLPENVNVENSLALEEFRSDKATAKTSGLEKLYQTLRRALIFLKPPPKKVRTPDLSAKLPEGDNVECTDAYKKLMTDAVPLESSEMFEGDCNTPGKTDIKFAK